MKTELLDKQARVIEGLSTLCRELIMLLAQYTDIEDFEFALKDIEGEL